MNTYRYEATAHDGTTRYFETDYAAKIFCRDNDINRFYRRRDGGRIDGEYVIDTLVDQFEFVPYELQPPIANRPVVPIIDVAPKPDIRTADRVALRGIGDVTVEINAGFVRTINDRLGKIYAIKLVRELTNLSLAECKNAVEAICQ